MPSSTRWRGRSLRVHTAEPGGSHMRQLSGMDASFVYLEAPRAPMHIGSVAIYDPSTAPDGKVTFKGILDHIQGRMPLVPSYREKLARVPLDFDHPYWVDDPDFDLEFHV